MESFMEEKVVRSKTWKVSTFSGDETNKQIRNFDIQAANQGYITRLLAAALTGCAGGTLQLQSHPGARSVCVEVGPWAGARDG